MRKIFVSSLPLLAGCGFLSVTFEPTPTGDTGTEPTETTEPEPVELDFPADVEISKISLYQGVEIVLREDNDEPFDPQPPVIASRDALLRVFMEPQQGYEARRLEAHLTVTGGGNSKPQIYEPIKLRVEGSSTNANLDSTFNFEIPADDLRLPTEFLVEVREANGQGPGKGLRRRNRFDSANDLAAGLNAQPSDELTIVIFPIQYDGDGSGRVPDIGTSAIANIRDWVHATYPTTDVTVEVRDVVPWASQIRTDNQWGRLLDAVVAQREKERNSVDPNTYFYAMFNPDSSLYNYCSNGCLLGLSYLAFTPNEPALRASIGVGFTQGNVAATTLAHEVGHAHGRAHAPCGYVQDVDPGYPHNGGSIGTWGYDIEEGRMYDPSTTADLMGYCSPGWVSDYNYEALYNRIDRVSAQARSVTHPVSTFKLGGEGETTSGPVLEFPVARDVAPEVNVALYDDTGAFVEWAVGWMHPYSHIPGGLVSLDRELPAGWTAELL